jgi:hypothetical protein
MLRSLHSIPLLAVLLLVFGGDARADDTVKHPGDHPHYSVELEPHGLVGWAANYYGFGFGLGGRVSIPVTHDGFIKKLNNSVAVSFGLDWVHYSGGGCYYYVRNGCFDGYSADFVQFPIVMQWNFYVAQHWSVFAEPGIYVWHAFYNTNYPCNGPGLPPCGAIYYGSETSVGPAFYVGGRYHFNDTVALTMRLGFPTISVGVSFMP